MERCQTPAAQIGGRVNVATKEVPVEDPAQKSRIIGQDPAAGAHLEPGAKITLTFGT